MTRDSQGTHATFGVSTRASTRPPTCGFVTRFAGTDVVIGHPRSSISRSGGEASAPSALAHASWPRSPAFFSPCAASPHVVTRSPPLMDRSGPAPGPRPRVCSSSSPPGVRRWRSRRGPRHRVAWCSRGGEEFFPAVGVGVTAGRRPAPILRGVVMAGLSTRRSRAALEPAAGYPARYVGLRSCLPLCAALHRPPPPRARFRSARPPFAQRRLRPQSCQPLIPQSSRTLLRHPPFAIPFVLPRPRQRGLPDAGRGGAGSSTS
jgi:hypothetical protein